MTRNPFFLAIFSMIVLIFLLCSCSSNTADMTPTPDLTIVWSDDFEDGEIEDWGQDLNPGTFFFVEEGVLTSGPDRAGDIYHESKVSSGTWSFDLFFTPDTKVLPNFDFCLSCDKDYKSGFGFSVMRTEKTSVVMLILENGKLTRDNSFLKDEKLSGWNHFDITRDEAGNSKIFLNGALILEYSDELDISPQWFYLSTPIIGPFFDNLVVRNEVIEILPSEK